MRRRSEAERRAIWAKGNIPKGVKTYPINVSKEEANELFQTLIDAGILPYKKGFMPPQTDKSVSPRKIKPDMSSEDRVRELERIASLAMDSVEHYHYADSENNKWRERHFHWPELVKIVTDKEHLAVEKEYNKASDMMDKATIQYKKYKKKYGTSHV